MTTLELSTGASVVRIAPALGGAIVAFTCGGRHVLRPAPTEALADGNVRLASCYPLVPWSNRIRDGRLVFDGREHVLARNFGAHPHAIHGVGWQRAWSVAETSPQRVRLVLAHDASDATTTLRFAAEGVWRNDATELPLEHGGVPVAWRFAESRPLGSVTLDNVFTGWNGVAALDNHTSGVRTTLAADSACRFLVVDAPPAANYVAIEPVMHVTDAVNRAGRGAERTGFRTLAPGAAFSCTMRIAASARD
jgi:aldose 1-epimerase